MKTYNFGEFLENLTGEERMFLAYNIIHGIDKGIIGKTLDPGIRFTPKEICEDEALGSNCGRFALINNVEQLGSISYDYSDWKDDPKLKREAITFACNVWGYDPEEYLAEDAD